MCIIVAIFKSFRAGGPRIWIGSTILTSKEKSPRRRAVLKLARPQATTRGYEMLEISFFNRYRPSIETLAIKVFQLQSIRKQCRNHLFSNKKSLETATFRNHICMSSFSQLSWIAISVFVFQPQFSNDWKTMHPRRIVERITVTVYFKHSPSRGEWLQYLTKQTTFVGVVDETRRKCFRTMFYSQGQKFAESLVAFAPPRQYADPPSYAEVKKFKSPTPQSCGYLLGLAKGTALLRNSSFYINLYLSKVIISSPCTKFYLWSNLVQFTAKPTKPLRTSSNKSTVFPPDYTHHHTSTKQGMLRITTS